jgi:hypothetical protein
LLARATFVRPLPFSKSPGGVRLAPSPSEVHSLILF